jgi:nucleoside-diphosphate-sugar epimerase
MILLKPRVLLTGATGFIGRHVASQLSKEGYLTAAIGRNGRHHPIKLEANPLADTLDLSFEDSQLSFVCDETVLIHLAWGNVQDTFSSEHYQHTNAHYLFLKNAIDNGVKKIIISGTCYEYGVSYGPISADTPTYPITPYAIAKDNLHKSLRLLQQETPFELIWARIFYVYGPGQPAHCVLSQFDTAIQQGVREFPMSYGEQLLDYSRVEDVAQMLIRLINKFDGTYNVCSGQPISLRRFLENRAQVMASDITLKLGFYEYRKHESIAMWGAEPMVRKKYSFNEAGGS